MTGPIKFIDVLERNRKRLAPHVGADFIEHIGRIEERNQFDDDRTNARRELREALKNETDVLLRKEEAKK
jgi:hypothetical protein